MKIHIYILICVAIIVPSLLFAKSTTVIVDSYDIDAQYEMLLQQMESDYNNYCDSLDRAYEEYYRNLEAEYSKFEENLEKTWGNNNLNVSDQYRWVEYNDDYKSRSIVDFEKGEATVQILVTDEELKNKSLVEEKLIQSVDHLLNSKAETTEYESEYVQREEITETPVMDNLIDESKYIDNNKTVNTEELSEIIVEKEPIVVTKSNTNKDLNIVSINTKLNTDYLPESAKKYKDIVLKNANRFNISPSLIFGIMEQESGFSPTAGSHKGALGLMQIVPSSAGSDTYEFLYGTKKLVNKNYLFNPEKNIEMGVAYLHILETRYFKNVTDRNCRELCMIASYNTGAGNLSRAMAGHTNVKKVIPQINNMTYDELFNHLRKNLSTKEARDYIKYVTTKREKYM